MQKVCTCRLVNERLPRPQFSLQKNSHILSLEFLLASEAVSIKPYVKVCMKIRSTNQFLFDHCSFIFTNSKDIIVSQT